MAKYFGENPDSPLKAMVEQAIEDGVALVDAFVPAYEAMLEGATEEGDAGGFGRGAGGEGEPEARSVASSELPSKEDLWSMVQARARRCR